MAEVDRNIFATLRHAHRVWAVAAIHGEAARLNNLHSELADRLREGDRLVYLGNFMGRGPKVGATIDALLEFRRDFLAAPGMFACDVAYLRGQQEEMWQKLLQLQLAVGPAEVLRMPEVTGSVTIPTLNTKLRFGGKGWKNCRRKFPSGSNCVITSELRS